MSALPVELPLAPRRDAVVLPFPSHRVRPACAAAARPPAPLRLTRRGRLVATLTVTAVVLALVAAAAPALARIAPSAGSAGQDARWSSSVVVLPGQTLWEIAAEASTGGDVRDAMAEIRAVNDLSSSAVTAGQVLLVPVTD